MTEHQEPLLGRASPWPEATSHRLHNAEPHTAREERPVPDLWYKLHPLAAIAVALALFAAIFVLRAAIDRPADAVSILYVLPVALLAMTFGRLGGWGGAAAAFGLVALGYGVFHRAPPDALGWITRGTVLFLLGALLGHAIDRKRALHHWALHEQERSVHMEESARRARAALEISDSLIQGMAAAKWLIEQGKTDLAVNELLFTIERGERLVTRLLTADAGADGRRVTSLDEDGQ